MMGGNQVKVILTQDVKGLGRAGETVTVADGYARNYLIPKGLAEEATEGKLRALQERQKVARRKQAEELAAAQQLAARIEGLTLRLSAKAGQGGKLFGSVTNKDIAEKLSAELGVRVEKRKVELAEPIKATGSHRVTLRLHPEVTATLTVEVEGE